MILVVYISLTRDFKFKFNSKNTISLKKIRKNFVAYYDPIELKKFVIYSYQINKNLRNLIKKIVNLFAVSNDIYSLS
jgi:hypothetical protein